MRVADCIAEVKVPCAATVCLGQDEVHRIQVNVQLYVDGSITDDSVMVQMCIIHEYADFVIYCLRQFCLL